MTISEMVDDTGLVRGKDRESERKERKKKKKTTEQRREDQTSQQLSDEQGTEVTTRRGGLSESLPEGAPGTAEELLVCWDREGQGERQHTSFCYCVGEGEKDGGIILMA